MDQASASPAASCAHNPAAPRTLPSWQPFEDQAQTVGPPPARSSPRSEPHSEPVHIVPRPSSSALCQSDAKGYLLPDFYSGCAPRISGRLTEGLLLWRSQKARCDAILWFSRSALGPWNVSDKGQSRRFRDARDRCPYSKCRSAQKVDPFGSELGPPVRFDFAAKLRRLAKDRWGHDWKPIGHMTPRRFTGWDFERPGPVFGGMSE